MDFILNIIKNPPKVFEKKNISIEDINRIEKFEIINFSDKITINKKIHQMVITKIDIIIRRGESKNTEILLSKKIPRTLPTFIPQECNQIYRNFSYFLNNGYHQHILMIDQFNDLYENLLSEYEFINLNLIKIDELDLFLYKIYQFIIFCNILPPSTDDTYLETLDDSFDMSYVDYLLRNFFVKDISLIHQFAKNIIVKLYGNKHDKFIDYIIKLDYFITNNSYDSIDKFYISKLLLDLIKFNPSAGDILMRFIHSSMIISKKKSDCQIIYEYEYRNLLVMKCDIWRLIIKEPSDENIIKLIYTNASYNLFKAHLEDFHNSIMDTSNLVFSTFIRTEMPDNVFDVNVNMYMKMIYDDEKDKLKKAILETQTVKYINEKMDCLKEELDYRLSIIENI